MRDDRDLPGAGAETSAREAALAEVAERLRCLAHPHLDAATHELAQTQSLADLPSAPLWDLARAAADQALSRALHEPGSVEALRGTGAARLSQVSWQFVCNQALAALTEDAARELRRLRQMPRSTDLDG